MSFFPETVHCFARMGSIFQYRAIYHVYEDINDSQAKCKFELIAETEDPSDKPPFVFMYETLTSMYPESTDHLEDRFPPIESF